MQMRRMVLQSALSPLFYSSPARALASVTESNEVAKIGREWYISSLSSLSPSSPSSSSPSPSSSTSPSSGGGGVSKRVVTQLRQLCKVVAKVEGEV
mmetsp:Transcript_12165/g.32759  ORF Transcript_12165/g.32759 Transcript_12165/m.32759 type:complete len:96 (+) Transcript_12165:1-288(+)